MFAYAKMDLELVPGIQIVQNKMDWDNVFIGNLVQGLMDQDSALIDFF